jgi:formylglycine-generating enzyme required for sulfatase activity
MRKLFIAFLLLVLISGLSYGSNSHRKKIIRLQDNYYTRINNTLYAAQCEVTNKDYNVFLYAIRNDSALYQSCLYDSMDWTNKFSFLNSTPVCEHYHNHPAFDNFPIVDISWYAARKYCEWLTNEYNSSHPDSRGKHVFVLPSEKEWVLMADSGIGGFPKGFGNGRDRQGQYNENINTFHGNYDTIAADGGYFTVQVNAYESEWRGLFNVIGNVSEMTDTKDIQKGGSWWTELADCTISKKETIETPDPRVGFRVFVRILK